MFSNVYGICGMPMVFFRMFWCAFVFLYVLVCLRMFFVCVRNCSLFRILVYLAPSTTKYLPLQKLKGPEEIIIGSP